MIPVRILLVGALAAAGLLIPLGASAQTATAPLEGGPLHIVVPYPPGGSSDRAARLLADALGPRLNTTIVVDNKTGAGGRVAAQQVLREAGKQNTLLLANPGIMVVAPLVFKDVGYDPAKDYVPISQVTTYDFGLAVGSAVPVKEFDHLRAWMSANRDKVSAGIPATGSLPHFFALMLGEKMGTDIPVIGYKGSAPLLNDLLGGHVPLSIDTLDALEPSAKAGRLRVLATSGEQRSTTLPDVPTFKQVGLDLSASGWNALYAGNAMPPERRKLLATQISEAMAQPALQEKFRAADMVPVSSTQEETIKMLERYQAQWEPVIKKSGFKP